MDEVTTNGLEREKPSGLCKPGSPIKKKQSIKIKRLKRIDRKRNPSFL